MTLEELKQLMRNKLQREHEAMTQALNAGDVEAYDRASTNIVEVQKIIDRLDPPPPTPEAEPEPEPELEPEPGPEPTQDAAQQHE